MKKYLLMTAMIAILATPGLAWSQTAPAGGPQGGQVENGEHFQEHKAEILRHMNEHLAEIQKRMACVQAANDHQELHACLPEHGEGHEGQHR